MLQRSCLSRIGKSCPTSRQCVVQHARISFRDLDHLDHLKRLSFMNKASERARERERVDGAASGRIEVSSLDMLSVFACARKSLALQRLVVLDRETQLCWRQQIGSSSEPASKRSGSRRILVLIAITARLDRCSARMSRERRPQDRNTSKRERIRVARAYQAQVLSGSHVTRRFVTTRCALVGGDSAKGRHSSHARTWWSSSLSGACVCKQYAVLPRAKTCRASARTSIMLLRSHACASNQPARHCCSKHGISLYVTSLVALLLVWSDHAAAFDNSSANRSLLLSCVSHCRCL